MPPCEYHANDPVVGQSSITIAHQSEMGKETDRFENGTLTAPGGAVFKVLGNYCVESALLGDRMVRTVEGFPGPSVLDGGWTLRDDDDQRLDDVDLTHPLPQHQNSGAITTAIAQRFRPAYIDVVDASASGLNPIPSIAFQRNAVGMIVGNGGKSK